MGHDQERRGGRRLHRRPRSATRSRCTRIAAAPKQTIEIRSKALRAGAPVYIITVTRVDSGLTMIQLRAQNYKASLRAKAAAESCIG